MRERHEQLRELRRAAPPAPDLLRVGLDVRPAEDRAEERQREEDRHPAGGLGEKAGEAARAVEQAAVAGVQRAEHREAQQDVDGAHQRGERRVEPGEPDDPVRQAP
ncbi:MAG TPA: hypothetical protein VNT54_18490 [Solirubrobacteraceae bacterium]|nr:hypothetical protein [Solirubrobacteraceae bacterium]